MLDFIVLLRILVQFLVLFSIFLFELLVLLFFYDFRTFLPSVLSLINIYFYLIHSLFDVVYNWLLSQYKCEWVCFVFGKNWCSLNCSLRKFGPEKCVNYNGNFRNHWLVKISLRTDATYRICSDHENMLKHLNQSAKYLLNRWSLPPPFSLLLNIYINTVAETANFFNCINFQTSSRHLRR